MARENARRRIMTNADKERKSLVDAILEQMSKERDGIAITSITIEYDDESELKIERR